ncbi:SapC family protein [Caulobacter mirabilis]|uniref:Peptidase n=1 Tax=Caulobacter mirabilis TaxID=69666 RepID=A0A2D2B309_9CAUL|nr:SapC family protein [Caulobacter mirabilis]ATQ44594.1 peptidase [Caulobacter mirabilis]
MSVQDPAVDSLDNGTPSPLFYREPEALSSRLHADWRLKSGDLGFAAATHVVPIVVAEFARASRWYPVLFTAGTPSPVALLGLEPRNLFVTDGVWTPQAYVPAYVRRYPFGFMATSEPDRYALAIDAASDAVVRGGEEGEPLFADGEPGPLTREALKFCDAFQGEAAATSAFCAAVAAQGLLVDRRAEAVLPDGRRFGVEGFQVIDPERFGALPAEVVVDWHQRGWLGLAHFHLASLDRFTDLLALQGAA